MSFACFVLLIGKNLSYISLGTGPFALGTPPFTGGADSVEKPLLCHVFFWELLPFVHFYTWNFVQYITLKLLKVSSRNS